MIIHIYNKVSNITDRKDLVQNDRTDFLDKIEQEFTDVLNDSNFKNEFEEIMRDFVGRPTPLLYAENITEELGGAKIYLKLEGLANIGAHKINNALGQALLAKRLSQKHIIGETGAGQHGIAIASICAKLGLQCNIYMGAKDVRDKSQMFLSEITPCQCYPHL